MDRNAEARRLSSVLRHQALKLGIKVRPDGYVSIADLRQKGGFCDLHEEDFKEIVDRDQKNRFSIWIDPNTEAWYIRANQGHSFPGIDPEKLLTKVTRVEDLAEFGIRPNTICHGTYLDAWEKIKTEGLRRMRRNHIHFGANANALSGMRRDAEVVIYLDIEGALRDGIAFYISSNGVILSPGLESRGVIAPKYFKSFRIRNIQ